jgi:hypothetical protein
MLKRRIPALVNRSSPAEGFDEVSWAVVMLTRKGATASTTSRHGAQPNTRQGRLTVIPISTSVRDDLSGAVKFIVGDGCAGWRILGGKLIECPERDRSPVAAAQFDGPA